MAATAEKADIFSRCNIPDDLIRRLSSKASNTCEGKTQATKKRTTSSSRTATPTATTPRLKRHSAPAITVSQDITASPTAKNKNNLERFLLSVPLGEDVANFSDTEGPSAGRLPLYSDNYESESFILPSAGYKSDSEGRGRSKYRIRTSHSANPSPEQSPERPANKASVRRTRSLNVPTETERVLEIRQRLRSSKKQELLKNNTASNSKTNIHERLKQLNIRGLNIKSNSAPTSNSSSTQQLQEKTVSSSTQQKTSLRSSSLNIIADTEKPRQRNRTNSQETKNENPGSSSASVLRSRSFNLLRNSSDIRAKLRNTTKTLSTPDAAKSKSETFQPSSTSAFEKVRQHFGTDKWKRRNTTNALGEKNEGLRSSSFSSLQDAWENRKAFEKNNNKTRLSINNDLTRQTLSIHKNSFSDFESTDIITRRRERRRLKRELYDQRLSSDRSDSEPETEDSHFERHALERLERRRTNSNPRRVASRTLRHNQSVDGNNSDSNDENNNECPSDKTLDSGVFDIALSNLSANICKLSKRYNSDEFLADCLSPKSGYSSATESLAESLAESTTTFCDSNDEHNNDMDPRRKRAAGNRSKLKTDKMNAKTAVLNATRAKATLNGVTNGHPKQTSNKSVKKELTGMSPEKKSNPAQILNDPKQTVNSTSTDIGQTKPQSKVNKKQSLTATDKASTLVSTKNSTANNSELTTSTSSSKPQKEKQTLEKKPSVSKTAARKQEAGKSKEIKDDKTTDSSSTQKTAKENQPPPSHTETSTKEKKQPPTPPKKKDSIVPNSDKTDKGTTPKEKKQPPPTPSKKKDSNDSQSDKTENTPTKEKKQPPPTPKKKNGVVEKPAIDSIKSTEKPFKEDGENADNIKKNDVTENKSSPSKTPKNGLLSKDRKISHHNCCKPADDRSESPAEQKKSRRVSHHGCFSTTDRLSDNSANNSRSSTPTKSRRVSHAGCISSAERTSDSDNSRSNTPTRSRRVSAHHNCFKPVNSSDSDNSRSNTPTLTHQNSSDASSNSRHNKNGGERRISHHSCVDTNGTSTLSSSPTRQQEQSTRKHSLQHQSTSTNNNSSSAERKMSNTNANYRIQVQTNSSNKAVIVGPAQRKDEIKPKLARECVSPTLSNSTTTNVEKQQQTNKCSGSESDSSQSTQLSRIDENHMHDTRTDGRTDKNNVISGDQYSTLTNYDNGIISNTTQHRDDEEHVKTGETRNDQNNMSLNKKINSLKFSIDQNKSSVVSQTGKQHRLIRQGESIELNLSLDNINQSPLTSGKAKPPSVATKPSSQANKTTNSEQQEKGESLHKAVQCLLLSGTQSSQVNGTKVVNVNDTCKQITIENENVIKELGSDILEGIQFTYPEYLLSPEQKDKLVKDFQKQQQDEEDSEDDTSDEEGEDQTDSAATTLINTKQQQKSISRMQKQKQKSLTLQMENTRLQQLLYEVEKARAGTMKALLHVNTALNKVQGENTQLEGDLKVTGQENLNLQENVKDYKEKEQASIESLGSTGGKKENNRSLSIFVDQWKKEKRELLGQLNTIKGKKEESEKASTRLQVQYKKCKEQLEHSNNAFTMTLQNNLEATKRMEEELKSSLEEKQEMLKRLNEGNKYKRELEALKNEMEELKAGNEELQDENDSLERKCKHLEKQKKQLHFEEEELHDQIGHSQDIIEKLTVNEEELKERLQAEILDKEYLQECLDETGNILYQLKNNEVRLKEDKNVLIDELDQEVEEKQTLQTTLKMTVTEHKEIVNRLSDMTNIHINVKESLQQANKKERDFQDQVEALTKTNHILHYTLEKEKEERMDLQEMFDIIESDHKKFKNETLGRIKDMETKNDDLSYENHQLKETKVELEKKREELQASLEQEEEENSTLTQKLSRLEKLKEAIDQELESLQDNSEEIEKTKAGLQKQCHELEVDLKISKQKCEKLMATLEESEELLEKAKKDLLETKRRLEEYRNDYDDLQSKSRERMKKIRDLESSNEELTELKERYQNRMNYYENETKDLRKKVNEQTEEIGTLQIESQRFQRERDTHRRNCEMSVNDFETHKTKCTDTLKKLKDEIIELSSKIVEKDRLAMKQKEHFQDQIENTQNDLKFLRSMLDSDIKKTLHGTPVRKISEASDSGSEKLDLGILRNSHDRFRNEFQSHVDKLENMLKNTNECDDLVTVVKSPMSKIKLEELKQIRNEMFELQADLTSIKTKYANLSAEITSIKLGTPTTTRHRRDHSPDERLEELENELTKLNELITRIESRHKAVMTRNAVLLQRTLKEDDPTSKDLVKKFQVISLEGENKQLKTLLGILKKKYDFDENELADALKKVNEDGGGGEGKMTNGSAVINNNNNNNNENEYPSNDETDTSKLITSNRSNNRSDRTPTRTMSSRRAQRNYSFFNEAVGATDLSTTPKSSAYSTHRDLNQRSSGVSSYSSEDEDYTPSPHLPKRYNTLPPRARRPRT